MNTPKQNRRPSITTWMLILITIGAVDNIRNLPASALFGSKIIALYFLASLFFLIPTALVSAELSAKFPDESGIYSWVKYAFGQKWGFIAVWLQWIENVPFYPAILSFVAATIGYLISPSLASNKIYLLVFVLLVFWGLTIVNIFGIRLSARFSSFCSLAGLIIPMVLILSMGIIWYLSGRPLAVHLTSTNIFPHFKHLSFWVTMQGVLLGLCGIELATVHAKDTKNPRRSFPIALLISVVLIIFTLVLGSLSIAFIIPMTKLNLIAGIMQTFDHFLMSFHLHWLLPILGIMLAVGCLGSVNSWIIGPTRGLHRACFERKMAGWIIRSNQKKAPISLLLLQAILVSIIMVVFFLIPTVSGSYWLLSVLSAQIYMLMYMLMFVASMVLKIKDRQKAAHYQIPGGVVGHLIVAGAGFFGASFAFFICFIPPSQVHVGRLSTYELTLVISLFVLACMPLCLKGVLKADFRMR